MTSSTTAWQLESCFLKLWQVTFEGPCLCSPWPVMVLPSLLIFPVLILQHLYFRMWPHPCRGYTLCMSRGMFLPMSYRADPATAAIATGKTPAVYFQSLKDFHQGLVAFIEAAIVLPNTLHTPTLFRKEQNHATANQCVDQWLFQDQWTPPRPFLARCDRES